MPSLANLFSLGALPAWLSGSSQADGDVIAGKSTKSKERGKLQTIKIPGDFTDGKNFKEAIPAHMAAVPPSPSDTQETDDLADKLKATLLSETASPDADPVIHDDAQLENGEESSAVKADLETSSDHKTGRPCCDVAFESEYSFSKIKQAASRLGSGSAEYFDAIAHVYHYSPSQVARGKFLERLIADLVEWNWIPLDFAKGGGVKVIDYGAGTGLLSQALAPHVTEILAIDKSRKMVEQYNKIVAQDDKTKCDMKSVWGDLTTHLLTGKKVGIEKPDGVFAGFDMVAMCLAVDFFSRGDYPRDMRHKQLVRCLDVIINLIDENGTILIIDIDQCDKDCSKDPAAHSPGSPHEGLKFTGHSSKGIVEALEELGMEEIAVIESQQFLFEAKYGSGPDAPTMTRKEVYFILKAKRGALFEKRMSERYGGSHRANSFAEAGGQG